MISSGSEPRSRRERPSKAALTREGIIEAALEILAAEGLGKVTMRRIAAALDTGAASLYVYVRNTEDLHAQILDALLADMTPVAAEGSWRERLRDVLTEYGRILFEHPEIARLTMTTQPSGPHYFALVETVLELLAEGGVTDGAAAWGIDVLMANVSANAVVHGAPGAHQKQNAELSELAAEIAVAPSDTYPRVVQLGEELLSGTGMERFAWGLDVLINGIVATPR